MQNTKRNIPFFNYPQLWLDDKDMLLDQINETASGGGFIMQKDLSDFEKELSQYSNSDYAIGVGNATDGMEIFLEAIGLEEGDEIIISSHTMLATASAIVTAGGIPIPVDIGDDNLINPDAVLASVNSKTVGVMPTQLNGRTCKMDLLQDIADKNGLFIVEDAAQGLGSKYKGQYAGTFGLASCISFFPAKVLGCLGDAGAILTSNEDIYNTCFQIRDHGRNHEGDVVRWGRNSRLDNIQASILMKKFPQYNKAIERRRQIATIYDENLSSIEQLKLPEKPSEDSDHFDVFQNYELEAMDRDKLKIHLQENGIGTLIQWGGYAVHHYKNLGFNQELKNTDEFFKNCLMLPMNLFIDDEDVLYICSVIQDFYS